MIDQADKKRIKELFDDWMDLMDNREALNKDVNEMKKEVADILNVKTAVVTKLFSHLKKVYSGAEDELEELRELASEIRE